MLSLISPWIKVRLRVNAKLAVTLLLAGTATVWSITRGSLRTTGTVAVDRRRGRRPFRPSRRGIAAPAYVGTRTRSASADQAALVGQHHELDAVAGAHLADRAADVGAGRGRADVQPRGETDQRKRAR